MKKGHSQTQPKSGWYKGGSASTPGGARFKGTNPAANNPKGHKAK